MTYFWHDRLTQSTLTDTSSYILFILLLIHPKVIGQLRKCVPINALITCDLSDKTCTMESVKSIANGIFMFGMRHLWSLCAMTYILLCLVKISRLTQCGYCYVSMHMSVLAQLLLSQTDCMHPWGSTDLSVHACALRPSMQYFWLCTPHKVSLIDHRKFA